MGWLFLLAMAMWPVIAACGFRMGARRLEGQHRHIFKISACKECRVHHTVDGKPTGLITDATQIMLTCTCGEFKHRQIEGKWTKAELEGWAELEKAV